MSKKHDMKHLENKNWHGLMRKLVEGKALPKEFTFQELANICHSSKLFQWMLEGRTGFSLSTGDYIELTAQSASRLGMFLAGKSGGVFSFGRHGFFKFSKTGEGRGKRYRVEESPFSAQTLAAGDRLLKMMNESAPPPPAPVIAKLCVSADNKVVALGKLTFAAAKALEVWVKDQVKELRPPPSIHASVDIETWGTASGSAVSVIGAQKFNAKGLVGIPFYIRIDPQSCIDAGLSIDPDTVKWWMSQTDEARKEMSAAGVSLRSALEAFGWWLCDGNGKDIGVWGNGWDFDGGRLGDAYKAARLRLPWDYWQGRDLRTLEAEHPEVKDEPEGVAHNALDDARVQARKVIRCWEAKAAPMIEVKAA